MAKEFRLPDIGEGIAEGEIVKWHVSVGDSVSEDQTLVEVMTDKVTAEIPSPFTGIIKSLKAKEGEVIAVGAVLVEFESSQTGAAAPEKVAVAAASATKTAEQTPVSNGRSAAAARSSGSSQRVLAAPATRKLAKQLGIDLQVVTGTGPKGRVTPSDVRQCSTKPAAVSGTASFEQAETRKPFAGMRRKIAEHLVHSKRTAPHFAYVEEVDMTELVNLRRTLMPDAEAQGVKLTYLPFIIKAVVSALRAFPMMNSVLDDAAAEIVYKHYYHIGVAVATEQGLVVPVVKHAEHKSLLTLANEIAALAAKAREGRLALDDLKGGTFTLTSIGSIGGLFGIPIINSPEVGIMGINKISRRPLVKVINGQEQLVIRDVMHLSLSCDHRVVDGAEGAQFVKMVIELLENPARLLLS